MTFGLVPIVLLENGRLLCRHEGKYGVVNSEGWDIIPFVYDKFEKRAEANGNKYDVFYWVIDGESLIHQERSFFG